MPGLVWYWTKLTQSGIFLVRNWTKILDAGMPMQALVSLMPMPSFGDGGCSLGSMEEVVGVPDQEDGNC